jgi:hypothetical protein
MPADGTRRVRARRTVAAACSDAGGVDHEHLVGAGRSLVGADRYVVCADLFERVPDPRFVRPRIVEEVRPGEQAVEQAVEQLVHDGLRLE